MVRSPSTKARSRSVAHRWAAACAGGSDELWAVAVRYDEEDDAAAESFLVQLLPGRVTLVARLPGAVRGLAALPEGEAVVIDGRGVLHAREVEVPWTDARAVVPWQGGIAVACADGVQGWSSRAGSVQPLTSGRAQRLASSRRFLAALEEDGTLRVLDGTHAHVRACPAGHDVAALAVDDEGRVAVASGRQIWRGDAGGIQPLVAAPADVHALAFHRGRLWASSRAQGLFVVEEEGGSSVRVAPVKPSLRAHGLHVGSVGLVAVSDLFVATSDGEEILMRDLAPLVRVVERHHPVFMPDAAGGRAGSSAAAAG